MRQVLQDLRSGEIAVQDVPAPGPRSGYVLVAVSHSLVSAGTERAMAALGAKSLVGKARARPDLVRKTLENVRGEGVAATVAKVRGRLDEYTAFGYSCAGRVLDAGGVAGLDAGDRVACIGQGHASHAEVVSVPANLVVRVPPGVGTADAAFAGPAAIALHAVRLASVGPGDVVLVIGLGLIGRLAAALVDAAGATAIGTDPSRERRAGVALAVDADAVSGRVAEATRGRGADAVLVCAATPSGEPLALAADTARDRARIVVVGDVGLELDRRRFYEKELSLVVARSYGPGRYDRAYEEGGADYPVGYVRWTEARNVEAVLDLVARGRVDVAPLVTHRFPIADAAEAYAALADDASAVGVLLEYSEEPARERTIRPHVSAPRTGALRVGLLGPGRFARSTLLPILAAFDDVELVGVAARSGASAKAAADRYAAGIVTTDWEELVASDELDAVVIATPHADHAQMATAALRAGKAVFVEKPLAIDREGLEAVRAAADAGLLLVGHNRRFAPLAQRARAAVSGPSLAQIRVAAGSLEPGHWLEDPGQGGRVLGEISHFVDLAAFFARGAPTATAAAWVDASLLATLRFENGSAASIVYSTGDAGRLPKERVELLGARAAAAIDDFARLEVHGAGATTVKGKRDKGHRAELRAFVDAARGRTGIPVPLDEQLAVAEASLDIVSIANSLTTGG